MSRQKIIFFLLGSFVSLTLFAQTIQQKADELLTAYAKQKKFNGTALVAQNGKIVLQQGYGYRDAGQKVAHEADDIFQIGSVTKQITAAVIMQLQEEGKLSVKDKLAKYYPDYPNGNKITIENLLTHTSGIYNYTNDTALMRGDVTRHYTEAQVIATFKNRPLNFEPGSEYRYSNSAYSLLGYIIEKVTKQPYEQVVRQRIFTPLGMADSGFDFTHLNSSRKSKGYFMLNGTSGLPAPIVDSTIAYAAGAIYSTVGDLYKWERAVSAKKILTPESWAAVFTPYKNKYGYGWSIDTLYGKKITAHSGGIHGFTSYLLRFSQDDAVVILLDNASSSGLGKLAKELSAVVFGKPYDVPYERKEIEVPVAVLQQYEGEYELAPSFIIRVFLEGNRLKAQATNQPAFDLYAEKESRFFLKAVDAQVEFIKDSNGKVTELILYQNGRQPHGKKIK